MFCDIITTRLNTSTEVKIALEQMAQPKEHVWRKWNKT